MLETGGVFAYHVEEYEHPAFGPLVEQESKRSDDIVPDRAREPTTTPMPLRRALLLAIKHIQAFSPRQIPWTRMSLATSWRVVEETQEGPEHQLLAGQHRCLQALDEPRLANGVGTSL